MDKWVGKTAVVTGASAGIGEEIVREFARNGINVIGLARRPEKIEEIAKDLEISSHGKVYARHCDVSDLKSIQEAFKWIEDEFGSFHILVNNAGTAFFVKLTDQSAEVTEKLDKTIDTNLRGLVHCTRAGLPLIKKSEDYGMIINVSSILAFYVPFGIPHNMYAPTKVAMNSFSEALRHELVVEGDLKIRIANISPGSVKTDISLNSGVTDSTEEFYDSRPHILVEDVAQAVLFFLRTPYHVNITELTIKPVGLSR